MRNFIKYIFLFLLFGVSRNWIKRDFGLILILIYNYIKIYIRGLGFYTDYPRTSRSPFTTSAPGAAAAHFCPPVTTAHAPSASSARIAACSSRRINSSSTRTVSARPTSMYNRTRPTLTPGAVTWSYPAARQTRWSTPGRTSKRCSTVAPGNVCWATRIALGNRRARPSSPDHRRTQPSRFPPWCRHRRIPAYHHSRNYPYRCPVISSWIMCGISISRRRRSPRLRHRARSPSRPTLCPGWPSGVLSCFPVSRVL